LNIVYHRCKTKNCYKRSWISFINVVKPRIVMKDLEYHSSLWNQELLWKNLNIVYHCETKKNLGYQKEKLKDLDWTCFATLNFLTFPMYTPSTIGQIVKISQFVWLAHLILKTQPIVSGLAIISVSWGNGKALVILCFTWLAPWCHGPWGINSLRPFFSP
jgi:hypothetical protein